jgi:hypothetical protein
MPVILKRNKESWMQTQFFVVSVLFPVGFHRFFARSIKLIASLPILIGLLRCSSLILASTAMAVDCWKSVERWNGTAICQFLSVNCLGRPAGSNRCFHATRTNLSRLHAPTAQDLEPAVKPGQWHQLLTGLSRLVQLLPLLTVAGVTLRGHGSAPRQLEAPRIRPIWNARRCCSSRALCLTMQRMAGRMCTIGLCSGSPERWFSRPPIHRRQAPIRCRKPAWSALCGD